MGPKFLEDVTDLAGRIAEAKEETRAANALWVFQHIQKTAGTSIVSEIATNTPLKLVNVFPTDEEYARYTHELFDESIRRREAEFRDPELNFVTGHFRRMHLDTIESFRPAKFFTFVRDPVSRVVSSYRYQMSPAHPPYQQFAQTFPRFIDYINHPESQNQVAKAICAKWPFQDLEASLERFEFIGVADRYPISFLLMTAFLHQPMFPLIYARKTESTGKNNIELTEELRTEILKQNEADTYVYNRAVAVIERLRPQIMAMERVAAVEPAPEAG